MTNILFVFDFQTIKINSKLLIINDNLENCHTN